MRSIAIDGVLWLLRRPRLAVRITRDGAERSDGQLVFEVENRSQSVTSLEPLVECRYHYMSLQNRKVTKHRMRYFVRESDRRLDPYQARVFSATPESRRTELLFSWFRTYVFRPSSGVRRQVRIRNAMLEPVEVPRFWLELFQFRILRKVPVDDISTLEEYDRLRRSLGPH